jgi:hypothetical protein
MITGDSYPLVIQGVLLYLIDLGLLMKLELKILQCVFKKLLKEILASLLLKTFSQFS